MKIYNHDITLYTHDRAISNHLYTSRALGLTSPQDKVQLPADLKPEWAAIVEHYAQIGLSHTHDVIWHVEMTALGNHPNYEPSVYFFGDLVSPHDTYRRLFQQWDGRFCELVEFVNSKNNFIQLAEELGVPVPKTLRFNNLAAAQAWDDITFPCYVKPAVSDHGFGIMRCPDRVTLAQALAQLAPDEPLQLQAEVQATAFLNLQYEVTAAGVEPLLVSEQILEGCVHGGNRYPASHEPWDIVTPFAEWMGDRGMRGIFAVDVAVVPEATGTRYVAIECNPRYNGSSYPTVVAQRLGIPAWSSATYKTEARSLKDLDLRGLAFDPETGKGVVLVNWGTILAGKISVLLAGSHVEQAAIDRAMRDRLKHPHSAKVLA
ncbi:MAG TPA: peptide ligase PGM1-related protein [Candidatus Obscuribacterales bacterium]